MVDLSAATSWGAAAVAELENLSVDRRVYSHPRWGAMSGSAALDVRLLTELEVSAEWGAVTAAALFDVRANLVLVADCSWGPPISATRFLYYFAADVPIRLETQSPHLLGCRDICHGPDESVFVMAQDAHALTLLNVRDPTTVQVLGSLPLGRRPLAIASRVFKRGKSEAWVFVALARGTAPDSTPSVQAWQVPSLGDARMVNEIPTRYAESTILWAPDSLGTSELWGREDTQFIVIAGDGGNIELRTADGDMDLIISQGTGVYDAHAATVIPRVSLQTTQVLGELVATTDVWDILLFSERTARGHLLRYYRRQRYVLTGGEPELVTTHDLHSQEAFNAPQMEGPYRPRWANDILYGMPEENVLPQEYNSGGVFTSLDDEPPGFDREWSAPILSIPIIGGAELNPVPGPDFPPDWATNRKTTWKRDDFTGVVSAAFRDNREGLRQGRVEFEFIRGDGSIITAVEVHAQYRIAGGYKSSGPPYENDAWVTDERFANIIYRGHAFNGTFADGYNLLMVITPPEDCQLVRMVNWSYADVTDTEFPHPPRSRPRIFTGMQERGVVFPVIRYDHARVFTPRTELTYGAREVVRERERGLLGVDWQYDIQSFVPSVDRAVLDAVTADTPTLPRSGVFRVRGGYLHLHPTLGRVSVHRLFPEEFAGDL